MEKDIKDMSQAEMATEYLKIRMDQFKATEVEKEESKIKIAEKAELEKVQNEISTYFK